MAEAKRNYFTHPLTALEFARECVAKWDALTEEERTQEAIAYSYVDRQDLNRPPWPTHRQRELIRIDDEKGKT